MTAAKDNKGVPARLEADHFATNAPGLTAAPPQPSHHALPAASPAALPAAFRRALGGASAAAAVATPPKGARAIAAQAKEARRGAVQDRPLGHPNIGPRSGHK